jgi:AcrR family transcriptional regulator
MAKASTAAPSQITAGLLPPRASADGTHRRLLEEALVLFGERGFHGVSVREIATGAGVRASSLYAHIESKEQLLLELMVIGHEEHHDRLSHALLEAGSDAVSQITRLVEAHVRMHATYPVLARVSNRELAALSPTSRESVLSVRSQSEQLFVSVVERGIRLHEFDVREPWLAVAAIGAMGIRVAEWWDESLGYRVEDVAATYAEFAVRLLQSSVT